MDLAKEKEKVKNKDEAIEETIKNIKKNIKLKSLLTQVEKDEELVALLAAIEKGSNILRDEIEELYSENNTFKKGEYDENWLEVTYAKQTIEEKPFMMTRELTF